MSILATTFSVPDLSLPGPWARMKLRDPSIGLGRFSTSGRMGAQALTASKGRRPGGH